MINHLKNFPLPAWMKTTKFEFGLLSRGNFTSTAREILHFIKYGMIGSSVRLEASSVCQLKCPLCPTGQGKNKENVVGWGFLEAENFKKFADNHRWVRNIELSNWGEILLNPELEDILKHAYEKKINLTAANGVNFNFAREDILEGLVKYQMRELRVSIDGATNETYQKYRVGGNFDNVIKNIEKINAYKKQYQSSYPHLTWQFVVFGHNEHEIPLAREMAKKLDMTFAPKANWGPSFSPVKNKEKIMEETGIERGKTEAVLCYQLWEHPQVNWDGKLLGCCVNIWDDFGDAFKTNLSELLKSEKYQYTKEMLLGLKPARDDIPCTKCHIYKEKILQKHIEEEKKQKKAATVVKNLVCRAKKNMNWDQLRLLLKLWETVQRGTNFLNDKNTQNFEKALAEYLGVPHLLGVASGTDALILSLKALGIAPGDEVIVPSVSAFVTAGAVKWINATPIFVDIRLEDMNIDISKIEQAITPHTKAILPVHLNGVTADMEEIANIAKRHSLFVIEDAAQAIGSKYKGNPIGHYSAAACLSFNPTKIFSTMGDGGAVITKNDKFAEKIHMMQFYGAKPHEIHKEHPVVGISSRLSPLNAAVLLERLSELPALIEQARENYFSYQEALKNIPGVDPLTLLDNDYYINGHRFPIMVSRGRDDLLKKLKEAGIAARADHRVPLPYFPVLNTRNYQKGDFPAAEKISEEVLFLPTHGKIPQKQFDKTAEIIKNHIG